MRFIADAERDRLVSYKMVPEGDDAILEWYQRILERDEVAADVSKFADLSKKYQLNYLVSKSPIEMGLEYNLLYSNSIYYLYKAK